MFDPTSEERQAYVEGYSAVTQYNLKSNKFLPNPYNDKTDQFLWEAWEVGFNDAFEDEVNVTRIIEEMSND